MRSKGDAVLDEYIVLANCSTGHEGLACRKDHQYLKNSSQRPCHHKGTTTTHLNLHGQLPAPGQQRRRPVLPLLAIPIPIGALVAVAVAARGRWGRGQELVLGQGLEALDGGLQLLAHLGVVTLLKSLGGGGERGGGWE